MTPAARLLRIADQLGKMPAGSIEADSAVYDALGLAGAVLPYTRKEAMVRGLLLDGFEWMDPIFSDGTVYAACRRTGLHDGFPHHLYGQWGRTLPLAMCGAVLRMRASLARPDAS